MNIFKKMITGVKNFFGNSKPEPTVEDLFIPSFIVKAKDLIERVEKVEEVKLESENDNTIFKENGKKAYKKTGKAYVAIPEEQQAIINEKVREVLSHSEFVDYLKDAEKTTTPVMDTISAKKIVTKISGEQTVVKKKKNYRKPKVNKTDK